LDHLELLPAKGDLGAEVITGLVVCMEVEAAATTTTTLGKLVGTER
jgi:hypothetical protein